MLKCKHCGKEHRTLSGLASCLKGWQPERGDFDEIKNVPIPIPFPGEEFFSWDQKRRYWFAVNYDVYDILVQRTRCLAIVQQRDSSGRQGYQYFSVHKKYYLVSFDPFLPHAEFVEIPSARIARQGVVRTLKYLREQKNSQERLARAIAIRIARAKGKAMLAELPGAKLRKTQLTLPGGQVVDLLKGGLK